MLIFNTYNTLKLKETIYSIDEAYFWIHHYVLYHYKCSENFTPYSGGCLATRQKWPNLPDLVH